MTLQPTLLPAERPQEPSLAATIQAILANPDLTPEALERGDSGVDGEIVKERRPL